MRKLKQEREQVLSAAGSTEKDAIIDVTDAAPNNGVYGQQYSILESSMISELYERRRRIEAWDALEMLLPTSRRGWVLLVGLTTLAFILWSVQGLHVSVSMQRGHVELSANAQIWERKLWWSFVTRQGRINPGASTCLVTKGSKRNVVDSRGVQCSWDAVGADGCCTAPAVPVAPPTEHCASCRDSDGCCNTYEDCVQCCMVADHAMLLQFQLSCKRFRVCVV